VATKSKTDSTVKPFVISEHEEQLRSDRPDPFVVQFTEDGERIELADPELLDWDVAYLAAASESPFEVLAQIVPEEHQGAFFEARVSVGAMRQMVEAWREHYGIDASTYTEGGGYANRAARRAAAKKAKKNRK